MSSESRTAIPSAGDVHSLHAESIHNLPCIHTLCIKKRWKAYIHFVHTFCIYIHTTSSSIRNLTTLIINTAFRLSSCVLDNIEPFRHPLRSKFVPVQLQHRLPTVQ